MVNINTLGLIKRFGDVTAVGGVDLKVEDGNFLVIVGPSGCGKSTTLRLLSGLETPTSGDIVIGDRVMTDVEPSDRNVGMVFQDFALYPHMSARENMQFGMHSSNRYTEDTIERRVEEIAEMLDISDLLDRKPSELSGGEKQRVAIGRPLVRDIDLLLMDEPLSNLDAKLRVRMRAELAKIHEEFDMTTIYVTHDQTEAMTLGDQVAVMQDGQIRQIDPPQTLYNYPENKFVAEFMGEPGMNLIPADAHIDNESTVLEWKGNSLSVPYELDTDSWHQSSVILGIRPEDLYQATTPGDQTISAQVTIREPLGETVVIRCRSGQHELTVKVKPESDIREGQTVSLSFESNSLHLFHPETGEVIHHSARPRPSGAEN